MQAIKRSIEEAGLTPGAGGALQEVEYRVHPEGFGAPMEVHVNGQRIYANKIIVEQTDGEFSNVTLVLGGVTVQCLPNEPKVPGDATSD